MAPAKVVAVSGKAVSTAKAVQGCTEVTVVGQLDQGVADLAWASAKAVVVQEGVEALEAVVAGLGVAVVRVEAAAVAER